MDQFAQLRDRAKEFEKRSTQVFFVLEDEPAYIRQWLRGRDRCATLIPEFFDSTVSVTFSVQTAVAVSGSVAYSGRAGLPRCVAASASRRGDGARRGGSPGPVS